jgi:N6-L-threonylcarbamoyladenine synthase
VIDRLRRGLRIFRGRFGAPSALVAAGGVAANQAIRNALHKLAVQEQVMLVVPPPSLCTDNAAMIAWAGAERLANGLCDGLDTSPRARWQLGQVSSAGTAGISPATACPPAEQLGGPDARGPGAPADPAGSQTTPSAVA